MFDDEDFEPDGYEESEDWQPGERDHCHGGPPITGPLGMLYCACDIGQGATPDDCVCGPEEG